MQTSRLHFLLLPAFAMSVGWGLRGFIGGGPLGAMIPGALVALTICILLERKGSDAGVIAAFGAVGVGLGGQETYGQTIGLSFVPETQIWGLAGLALKGMVWGLAGGAILAVGLQIRQWARRDVAIALALLAAATHLGWKLVNEPKLIYFSNLYDRPRAELWAGLLLGGVAFLACLLTRGDARIPVSFGVYGAIGGFVGFGLGGWIQVIGRASGLESGVGWWKVMEFTFGFLFGLALGACAYRWRETLSGAAPEEAESLSWAGAVAGMAAALALYPFYAIFELRWNYTLVGALLLGVVLVWPRIAWHVAITFTFAAFAYDLVKAKTYIPWVLVLVTTAIVAWLAARPLSVNAKTLLLLWTAIAVAGAKLYLPKEAEAFHAVTLQGTFTAMAIIVTVLMRPNPSQG
ncbi:MAG: hypothetical protein JNN08_19795 [Bryobacterales bacterium]|nr:hypothetical protein [Bryobacterales bacterium]